MHNKKRYLSIATLVLCLALLISAFLVLPKVTQAASNTPISVTQPSNCTPLQADSNGNTLDYQTCVVAVSVKYNVSSGVHFSVSHSGKACFYNVCSTSSIGASYAMPEGNSITLATSPINVMLITPYYENHGYITMTFTFRGPSNNVSIQLVTHSCC